MERKSEPKPNFFRADYTTIKRKLEEVEWEEVLFGNFKESHSFLGTVDRIIRRKGTEFSWNG